MQTLNAEHATLVEDRGDRLSKPRDLVQLFYLNTLRGTFFRTQGRNVLLLTATPQNFDTFNRGRNFSVLLGRVEDKEPDGIITSG